MPYTAVVERSTTDRNKLKQHLRMHLGFTADDAKLDEVLLTAKEDADKHLCNPFTTNNRASLPNKSTDKPIPSTVESWVKQRAAELYEHRQLNDLAEGGHQVATPAANYRDITYLRDPAGRIGF